MGRVLGLGLTDAKPGVLAQGGSSRKEPHRDTYSPRLLLGSRGAESPTGGFLVDTLNAEFSQTPLLSC